MKIAKVLAYCTIGTMLEFYDYAIFGVLSSLLAKLFFPNQQSRTSLLLVLAIFSTGFIMRPLGGLVMGGIGDRYGRKQAMVVSILLMTIATLALGCLPIPQKTSYPIILLFIVCRMLQGLGVSGESNGSSIFMAEFSGKKQRFFHQAIIGSGITIGIIMATFFGKIALFYYHQQILYAWRLPFLVSVLLGIVGLHLRLKALESPIFLAIQQQQQLSTMPIKEVITSYWSSILLCVIIALPATVGVYYTLIYYPLYLQQLGMATSDALSIQAVGQTVLLLIVPVIGIIAGYVNFKTMMKIGMGGFLPLAIPTLLLVAHSLHYALVVEMIYIMLLALLMPMAGSFFTCMQFPSQLRYTATGVVMGLASIFGGLSPLIAEFSIKLFHFAYAPGFFISIISLIGVMTLVISNHKGLLQKTEIA